MSAASSSSVFIENTTDLEIITSAYLSPPCSSETGDKTKLSPAFAQPKLWD